MNERLCSISLVLVNPTEGAAAAEQHFEALTDMAIVGVTASPSVDDPGAVLDIEDDGTVVINDIDVSDNNVPGTWQATGYGGTNAVVVIAKDSLVSVAPASGANGTAFNITILYLSGEDWK